MENQRAGLGTVIRDSGGKIVVVYTKSSKYYDNMTFAKAKAIEWGMQIAKEVDLSYVIF